MRLCVVIPTLDEGPSIAAAIDRTRALGECTIIVADGGSRDTTLANAAGADHVLECDRGRALQQNAGAAVCAGDVLLFLHADSWLEPGAFTAISERLRDPRVVGGCFRQRIDADGFRYRLLEWGNDLRVRLLKWAYGDQGIFVRREVFADMGGFPELALMEDLYFMKQLKRRGRIALLPPRIHTSARRWQQRGVIRQTCRNWTLIGLAHCGVSPDRLSRFYPPVRERQSTESKGERA